MPRRLRTLIRPPAGPATRSLPKPNAQHTHLIQSDKIKSIKIGVFNHVSYCDAFVITWALCPAGLTFEFTREVPVLGRAINALQVTVVLGGGGCWVLDG